MLNRGVDELPGRVVARIEGDVASASSASEAMRLRVVNECETPPCRVLTGTVCISTFDAGQQGKHGQARCA